MLPPTVRIQQSELSHEKEDEDADIEEVYSDPELTTPTRHNQKESPVSKPEPEVSQKKQMPTDP